MARPSGHTLLTEALRVITRAIDANRGASPWREIVARTSGRRGPTTLAVAVHEGDPDRIVDRCSIRVHEGRLEMLERGRREPAPDWHVSVDELRRIVAEPDRYLAEPEALGLSWLESRLQIAARPKRTSGWRVGRVRRPAKVPRAAPRSRRPRAR
jgi:hypothetical protein